MNTPHLQDDHDPRPAFSALSEGWSALKRRAAHALSHFMPTGESGLLWGASRWGLLPAEVRETEDRVVVAMEAPGMRPEDFDVDVVEDVLIIRGEKRAAQDDAEGGRYFLLERAYGTFERTIHLPAEVDRDRTPPITGPGFLLWPCPSGSTIASGG